MKKHIISEEEIEKLDELIDALCLGMFAFSIFMDICRVISLIG